MCVPWIATSRISFGSFIAIPLGHWEDDTSFTLSLLLLHMHIYVSISEHLPPMKENEPVVLRPVSVLRLRRGYKLHEYVEWGEEEPQQEAHCPV